MAKKSIKMLYLPVIKTIFGDKDDDVLKRYGRMDNVSADLWMIKLVQAVNVYAHKGYRFNGFVVTKDEDFLVFERSDTKYDYTAKSYEHEFAKSVTDPSKIMTDEIMHCSVVFGSYLIYMMATEYTDPGK